MKYISHRGNITHKNPERENSLGYILEAIDKGYDVELDIWHIDDSWYLGHDKPLYKINDLNIFLPYSYKLWFHCKNYKALEEINKLSSFIYFWHQMDCYTITSNGFFWTFPGIDILENSIICLPELGVYTTEQLYSCKGICSDYIEKYKIN